MMRTFKIPRELFCLCALVACSIAAHAQTLAPETVLLHGKIWTENPAQPEAEAIATFGDKIVAVGSSEEIGKLAGPQTRIIELRGRRVLPGFNDAHVHLIEGGMSLTAIQLRDAPSPQEMRRRLAEYVSTIPASEWVLNGEWDQERWTPADLPTHQLIDDVTEKNPVFVERLDGHMALANALAMKLAGVDRNTPDVPGGEIVRDAAGNPTGIFKDAARSLINRVIPEPSKDQLQRALAAAQKYASENGVTSVQDMWGGERISDVAAEVRLFHDAWRNGTLQIRISKHQPLPQWKQVASLGVDADFGNDWLHIGGLKAFADGSLGSRTAWMLAPYADAPADTPHPSGFAGAELQNVEGMYADMAGADKAGLQIAVHAIGDRANRTILDMYEQVEKENGPRDRRLRIEHAQHLSPQDVPRFAQLHVIASMQPLHLADDGRWAEKRVGAERTRQMYMFRSLLDSGAVVVFGSDWPVAAMKPLQGIYEAVTRRTLDGKHPDGWMPAQKISITEAIHAYTVASAYAEFEDGIKGSLQPGKLADLVVLDEDILHANENDLANAHVDMTMVAGKVVFERK